MPEFHNSKQRSDKSELSKVFVHTDKNSKPVETLQNSEVISPFPKMFVNGKEHSFPSDDRDDAEFSMEGNILKVHCKPGNQSSQKNGSGSTERQHASSVKYLSGDAHKVAQSRQNQQKGSSNEPSSYVTCKKKSFNLRRSSSGSQRQNGTDCSSQATISSATDSCQVRITDRYSINDRYKLRHSNRCSRFNSSRNHIIPIRINNSGKDKTVASKPPNSLQNRNQNESDTSKTEYFPQSSSYGVNSSTGNRIPGNTFLRNNFSGNNKQSNNVSVKIFPCSSEKSKVKKSDLINTDGHGHAQEIQSTSKTYRPISVHYQTKIPGSTDPEISNKPSEQSHSRNKSWPRRSLSYDSSLHSTDLFTSPFFSLEDGGSKGHIDKNATNTNKCSLNKNENVKARKNCTNNATYQFNSEHNSRYDQFQRKCKQGSTATHPRRPGSARKHAETQVRSQVAGLMFQPNKDQLYSHSQQATVPQSFCNVVTSEHVYSETAQTVCGQMSSRKTTNKSTHNPRSSFIDTNQCKKLTHLNKSNLNLTQNLNTFDALTTNSEIVTRNPPKSAPTTNRFDTLASDMNSSLEGELVSASTDENFKYQQDRCKTNLENKFETFTYSASQIVPVYDPSVHPQQVFQDHQRFTQIREHNCNPKTINKTKLRGSQTNYVEWEGNSNHVSSYWTINDENRTRLLETNNRTNGHKHHLNSCEFMYSPNDNFKCNNLLNNEKSAFCGSNFNQKHLVDTTIAICAEGHEGNKLSADDISFRNEIEEEMARAQKMSIPMNVDTRKNFQPYLARLNPDANEFSPTLKDNLENSFQMAKMKESCYLTPVANMPVEEILSTNTKAVTNTQWTPATIVSCDVPFENYATDNYDCGFQSFSLFNIPREQQNQIWQDTSLELSHCMCPNDLYNEVSCFDALPTILSSDAQLFSPYVSVFPPGCAQVSQSSVPLGFVYPMLNDPPVNATYIDHQAFQAMNLTPDPQPHAALLEPMPSYAQNPFSSPCYSFCSFLPTYYTQSPVAAFSVMPVPDSSEYYSFLNGQSNQVQESLNSTTHQSRSKVQCKGRDINVNDTKCTESKTNINNLNIVHPKFDKAKSIEQNGQTQDNLLVNGIKALKVDNVYLQNADTQRKIDNAEFKECKAILEKLTSGKIALDLFEENFASEPLIQRLEMKKWLKLALQILEFNESSLTVDEMVDVLLKTHCNKKVRYL